MVINLTQVGAILTLLILMIILGALPLIKWIFDGLTGRQLQHLGTGNLSVSAAFQQGGKLIGILAVLSEASKGMIAILVPRFFFPHHPAIEILSLIALVIGRYWATRGAGVTNVFWGMMIHDWQASLISALISLISFKSIKNRFIRYSITLLSLGGLLIWHHYFYPLYITMVVLLITLMLAILQRIPDDL